MIAALALIVWWRLELAMHTLHAMHTQYSLTWNKLRSLGPYYYPLSKRHVQLEFVFAVYTSYMLQLGGS